MSRLLPPTAWALCAATLIIAHQVAGKATRDAIFLSQFEVADLPKVVMTAAMLSILAVFLIARLLARFGPLRVICSAFVVSALCFIGEWLMMATYPKIVAVALYLQMATFGAVLISGFWSVINERFDPYTAKQTIAKVGAAATLGGVIGGVIAGQVPTAIDLRAMLLVLAFLHFACALVVQAIGESHRMHAPATVNLGWQSGVQLLMSHRYLQLMGCAMVVVAVLAAILDYAFKSQAAASLQSGEQLAAFFGQFYAVVGVVTFVVQSLLGPQLLKRFGIGVTLGVMPAFMVLLGCVALAIPRFGSIVIMRAAQMAFGNSFFRAAFELLYTPLPPLTKRPTKAIIDVASDRVGDLLGSGLLLGLLLVVPTLQPRLLAGVAILCALVILLLVLRLYRGYIEQLADSLRAGAINLSEDEVLDATTRHTLAEASPSSERALLMMRIRQMKLARKGAVQRPLSRRVPRAELSADPNAEALAKAIIELSSGDFARIKFCLHGRFMDPRLVPALIPLLESDALAEDVRMELRWMAPQIIGSLSDALSNPDLSLAARQRLPSVLEVVHNARATAVLMDGLEEEEFNIRYSCARALARMRARDPYMKIAESRVYAAIEREVNVDQTTWSTQDLQIEIDLPEDLMAAPSPAQSPLNYSMEHVFTLLGLVLDREALSLALQAVASSDRNLSGTALEYLENVLPEDVRKALWPRLNERDALLGTRRDTSMLEADLKRRSPR